MAISNNWFFALGLLSVGVGLGGYVDHRTMQSRIDKMTAAHSEELRVREVQRAKDEAAARAKEQTLTAQIATIEQARVNENTASSTAADALRQRLRNQAASKPANPSGVPQAAASCKAATGGAVLNGAGEDYVRLAERADQARSALSACYQAYDSVSP